MLKHLRIRNFKIWEDTGTISMKPLTLLFGANSSGKSSIGHLLMMLKQTVESADRKVVLSPGSRNLAVQSGSYREIIHHRNPKLELSFEYEWELPDTLTIKDPISKKSFFRDNLTFNARIGLDTKDRQTVLVNELKYNGSDLSITMQRRPGSITEYRVSSTQYELQSKQSVDWLTTSPVRFYGFPDDVVAHFKNADFVQELKA